MARIAEHAVVIGAGMGGLAAAAAVAPHFERVTVLERDALPDGAEWRVGTPQCRHAHGLLVGGLKTLEALAPGYAADLAAAGGVGVRIPQDVQTESPGLGDLPRHDLGLPLAYFGTRPLLEHTLRRRLTASGAVVVRDRCRARSLTLANGAVTGVAAGGEDVPADLVIDASGRGAPTMEALQTLGYPPPEETVLGVDATYCSALVRKPAGWVDDWLGCLTYPVAATGDHLGGFLFSAENRQWMLSIIEMHGELTEGWDALLAKARRLRTPTIYEAIKDAEPVETAAFKRASSTRRWFERMQRFPPGLVAIGDAITQINPIYGQGMSVAAQQAEVLGAVLAERVGAAEPLAGLAEAFFAKMPSVTDGPWTSSAAFDLQYPLTRGERPPDLAARRAYASALGRLAIEDPAVLKIYMEVNHCLRSPEAFGEPALAARVADVMRRTEQAA
jgi:2-polyprenyl-6-methoxyphenol hydroxylase-like FAD-dependent oxidoreductase